VCPPAGFLHQRRERDQNALGAHQRLGSLSFEVRDGHTYAGSIELIRDRLDFLSADDREWLAPKTAERVFFGGS
jgi:hypothetical protein